MRIEPISTQPMPIAPHYIASNPLWGRVQKNWQTLLMGAGIVVSIITFIVCFFAHLPLACFGSCLLGIISAIGMQQFEEKDTSAEKLEKQVGNFKKEIGVFKKENETLKESNRDLRRIRTELEGTNKDLQVTKEELAAKVIRLEDSTKKIALHLKTFNDENQQFGGTLNGLTATAINLEETRKNLDDGLGILECEIGKSRSLWKDLKEYLQTIRDGKLGEVLQGLEMAVKNTRAENLELTKIRTQITQSQTELQTTQATLASEVEKLTKIRQEIDTSVDKLGAATDTLLLAVEN